MGWTDEQTKLCVKLWGDGLSAEQIAHKLLGAGGLPIYTRNAVLSKIHRTLGEKVKRRNVKRGSPVKRVPPKPKTAAVKPAVAACVTKPHPPAPPKAAAAGPADKPLVVIAGHAGPRKTVSFFELKDRHCRWPFDAANGGFEYCGAPASPGRPYCSEHTAIAYVPLRPRQAIKQSHPYAALDMALVA